MVYLRGGLAAALSAGVIFGVFSCSSTVDARRACSGGPKNCVIRLSLPPRGGSVTIHGDLVPRRDHYSYAFKARSGQKLTWAFDGPEVHAVIKYPSGDSKGPGLMNVIELSETGVYIFTIGSNTMAEGIYGPFKLKFEVK
jgi:hypothetical protein